MERSRIMEDLNLIYIRQMAQSLQDTDFQKKIDHEVRMREGACKLLAACTQRQQALEAAKSLLTCNNRIMAYMSTVQRMKEAQLMQRKVRRSSDAGLLKDRSPCKGKVAISDLRIPLMWKDTDYFKNRGDFHRYAVFALLKIGCDIYDTDMVLVDCTMSDICFENAFVLGPKYHLLAHTNLSLPAIHSSFWTHSLRTVGNESCCFWLPLYGSVCCQLAAQPLCMTQQIISSFLNLQQRVGERQSWTRMFCVLLGTNLFCYYSPEEVEAKVDPAFTIAINKETRIRAMEKDTRTRGNSLTITNLCAGEEVTHTLVAESVEQMYQWMEAFWQHFCDMSAWKQCCEELMKIETASPRKLPVPISTGVSLYHQTAIDSPGDDVSVWLAQSVGGDAGLVCPPWYVLFENSPKTVCRHGAAFSDDSAAVNSTAKTWDVPDFSKTDSGKPLPRGRTLSLDSKLTTVRCQEQRGDGGQVCTLSSDDSGEDIASPSPIKPFPQPALEQSHRRNVPSKLSPRNWLQTPV
ncbi:rhotekin-like isoform X2 [Scyliorhinus torazame]